MACGKSGHPDQLVGSTPFQSDQNGVGLFHFDRSAHFHDLFNDGLEEHYVYWLLELLQLVVVLSQGVLEDFNQRLLIPVDLPVLGWSLWLAKSEVDPVTALDD